MTRGEADASLPQPDGTGQREGGVPLVILAGGRGSRLNGDKALAPFAGATLLDAVIGRVRAGVWQGPIAINANGDPARFARFALPVIADSIADYPGPLAGILAAMDWAAAAHPDAAYVATVPTDAPLLPTDLLDRMSQVAARETGDVIFCCESASGRHPVIALWPVTLRTTLRPLLAVSGMRRVREFQGRCRQRSLYFDDPGFDAFVNVNSAAELAAAEALAGHVHPAPEAG